MSTRPNPAALAAKQVTAVIPIVFAGAGDPIGTGLVASLARPGGNVTGLSTQQTDLASKRLEMLREALPGLHTLAILADRGSPNSVLEMGEARAAAYKLVLPPFRIFFQRLFSCSAATALIERFPRRAKLAGDPFEFSFQCVGLRINQHIGEQRDCCPQPPQCDPSASPAKAVPDHIEA
jgi:hypothetical protein